MRKSTVLTGLIIVAAIMLTLKFTLRPHALSTDQERLPLATENVKPQRVTVGRGRLSVWKHYVGQVSAEKVDSISSHLGGPAVIVFLAPQGSHVRRGDVLVRFDTTETDHNLVALKQDFITARSELNSLVNAELPIAIDDIKGKISDQKHKVELEQKFLSDSQDLEKQGLLSAEEVNQEHDVSISEEDKLKQLQEQLELTEKYEDPAKVEQARTKVAATEEALRLGEEQLADSVVRSPVDGIISYEPINVANQYRTARLGDTVYKNQTFMMLPNTQHMVVDCEIPESDFDEVSAGMRVEVSPVSRPELTFGGTVQSIEAIASAVQNLPSWQRYFHTTVMLDGENIRLYSGMSVSVSVLSYDKGDVVLVPRAAVHWSEGRPYVVEPSLLGDRNRYLRLGHSDDSYYEVLSGIEPGDSVFIQ